MPSYKTNCHVQGDNIYHIKNTVSDLKDSDFALVALEHKLNLLEREINKEVRKKNINSYIYPIPLGNYRKHFGSFVIFLSSNKKKGINNGNQSWKKKSSY